MIRLILPLRILLPTHITKVSSESSEQPSESSGALAYMNVAAGDSLADTAAQRGVIGIKSL